jgi:hypothetical protein
MAVSDILFADALEKLKSALSEGRTIDAAKIGVVGLDDIRRAAGDDWDRIKNRVRQNSLLFLSGCLDAQDIVIPAGDGFLVVFAPHQGRDLSDQCAQLRLALNTFFLGGTETQTLRATVVKSNVDIACVEAIVAAQADTPENHLSHKIFCAPAWNASREVVSAYFFSPGYMQHEHLHYGYNPLFGRGASEQKLDYAELDMAVIEDALAAHRQCTDIGKPCIIGASLHNTTLQNRATRRWMLHRLSAVPPDMRRYLMIKVAEIDPGTPSMRIAEWVGYLKASVERIMIEMHPEERSLATLDTTGAFAVSCSSPPLAALAGRGMARSHFFSRWTTQVHAQRLKVCFDNLDDRQALAAAVEAGPDFITSAYALPPVDSPTGLIPLSRSRLLGTQSRAAA